MRVAAEQGDGPKFSFESNKRAAVGYTEEDSAGQTNIFAVEVRGDGRAWGATGLYWAARSAPLCA